MAKTLGNYKQKSNIKRFPLLLLTLIHFIESLLYHIQRQYNKLKIVHKINYFKMITEKRILY
jgi:hypothetical protein